MTFKVIYVYSTTTFTTDMTIEPRQGSLIGPGTVTLARGLYRVNASASVVALPTPNTAAGTDYDIVTHDIGTTNGTKTPYPDPPNQAAQRLDLTEIDVKAWAQGGGEAVSI